MNNSNPIYIQLVGFTPSTRTLFRSAFAGFSKKGRICEEATAGQAPSIYLLDGDDQLACEQWREQHKTGIDAPVIAIGRAPFSLTVPVMQKPLQWAKLYELLIDTYSEPAPVWTETSDRLDEERTDLSFESGLSALRGDTGKRLLVVDDSATVRHYMSIKLSRYDVTVDYAESGEDAVACCSQHNYAAVFLDVVMPGMDGYETCKKLRQLLPVGTPIIMATTRDSPFDKMRGTVAGCSSYLVKPLDDLTISEIMLKWLKTVPRRP